MFAANHEPGIWTPKPLNRTNTDITLDSRIIVSFLPFSVTVLVRDVVVVVVVVVVRDFVVVVVGTEKRIMEFVTQ